jgi:hypothetical protein
MSSFLVIIITRHVSTLRGGACWSKFTNTSRRSCSPAWKPLLSSIDWNLSFLDPESILGSSAFMNMKLTQLGYCWSQVASAPLQGGDKFFHQRRHQSSPATVNNPQQHCIALFWRLSRVLCRPKCIIISSHFSLRISISASTVFLNEEGCYVSFFFQKYCCSPSAVALQNCAGAGLSYRLRKINTKMILNDWAKT